MNKRSRKISAAALLISAACLASSASLAQTPTPTPKPLNDFFLFLKRPQEKPVLPALGNDVWRFRAILGLPASFEPQDQTLTVSISGPPTLEHPAGLPHVNPLFVLQLLPRGSRWTREVTTEENGECRVNLVPRPRIWSLSVRCRGVGAIPKFQEALQLTATVTIGTQTFSGPGQLRQLLPTVRRYP